MIKKKHIFILTIMFIIFGCSSEKNNQGKQIAKDEKKITNQKDLSKFYSIIPENIKNLPVIKNNKTNSKIIVIEFFNYACPACSAIEKNLQKWRKSFSHDVEFRRIPVVYHTGWLSLAKAYYVAEQLNIQNKITPQLFSKIHQKKENLMNKKNLESFFKTYKIESRKFQKLYNSFYTERSLEQGRMLRNLFNITSIPAVIINNTYKTSMDKNDGYPLQFITVLEHLIKKVKKENKQ